MKLEGGAIALLEATGGPWRALKCLELKLEATKGLGYALGRALWPTAGRPLAALRDLSSCHSEEVVPRNGSSKLLDSRHTRCMELVFF